MQCGYLAGVARDKRPSCAGDVFVGAGGPSTVVVCDVEGRSVREDKGIVCEAWSNIDSTSESAVSRSSREMVEWVAVFASGVGISRNSCRKLPNV